MKAPFPLSLETRCIVLIPLSSLRALNVALLYLMWPPTCEHVSSVLLVVHKLCCCKLLLALQLPYSFSAPNESSPVTRKASGTPDKLTRTSSGGLFTKPSYIRESTSSPGKGNVAIPNLISLWLRCQRCHRTISLFFLKFWFCYMSDYPSGKCCCTMCVFLSATIVKLTNRTL